MSQNEVLTRFWRRLIPFDKRMGYARVGAKAVQPTLFDILVGSCIEEGKAASNPPPVSSCFAAAPRSAPRAPSWRARSRRLPRPPVPRPLPPALAGAGCLLSPSRRTH